METERTSSGKFDYVSAVAQKAVGRCGEELTFALAQVIEVVGLYSDAGIAVLGVEVFQLVSDGLRSETFSGYEVSQELGWRDYVSGNDALDIEFITTNPFGEGYVYILTTLSWPEFCEINRLQSF